MKKIVGIISAVILTAVMAVTLCACGGGLTNANWKAVGLDSSTLELPELEINSTNASNNKDSVMLSILWDGGSEDIFNALAEECFNKIPANKDAKSNEVGAVSDLIDKQDDKIAFNAMYGSEYACSVIYFVKDCNYDEVTYKEGQILLMLQKMMEQTATKYSWGIDSDDKTWFTDEELENFGLVGLQAPQGKILGKIVEGDYARMSIEISSNDIYDAFIKTLFEDYNLNTTVLGEVAESYHDDMIYRLYDDRHGSFTPCYTVGEKKFNTFISLDDGHIVIELMGNN
ncbi:MAG: hypothetical protein HDT32_06710 [Clostridiales bacterium]|nr:hypothetical protein [Clostridiales bacterium]